MKHDFDQKKYQKQTEDNNLIAVILSLGTISLLIILYILATALKAGT